MLQTLIKFYTLQTRAILIGALVFCLVVVFFVGRGCTPEPVITTIAPTVRTIEVPVERITERVVKEYVRVEDRRVVEDLLRTNEGLGVQVQELTTALAAATSRGAGPVTITQPLSTPPSNPFAAGNTTVNFKDWRLTFSTNGANASYTLSQKFALHNSVGVNEQNVPVSLVKLYEIGPGDVRTEIPVTESTLISTAKPGARFYVDFGIQLGFNLRMDSAVKDDAPAELLVAFPWLKRGRTTSVADTRWAFLTPAFTVNGTQRSLGVLPLSYNLGTFPVIRRVFSDVWVSPYVGTSDATKIDRTGIVLSTTF